MEIDKHYYFAKYGFLFERDEGEKTIKLLELICLTCRSYDSLPPPDIEVDDESFCNDNTNSDFRRVNANA